MGQGIRGIQNPHSLRLAPPAEAQGIEPSGPRSDPAPVLKTGEPTRCSDASGREPTGSVTASDLVPSQADPATDRVRAKYSPTVVTSGAELARMLRERRRALGLTRMRLAKRCGLAALDIAQWERGEGLPDPDQIVVLAVAVGLDDDEIQAWLDASTVDLAGPEVGVEIVEGDERRVNPIPQRVPLPRSWSSRPDGIGEKVGDPSGNASPAVAGLEPPTKPPPPSPAPSRRTGLVMEPVGRTARELPLVSPDSQIGSYDPAVRVYSTAPSTYPSPGDEQLYLLRRIGATGVLLGLGVILWWAFGALGDGLGDVLDLFRTPVDTSRVP